MYDVLIIGAGVIGCAIARELARYELHVAVLERASDVCEGTSKANSGIVHAGFDAKPGTRKAMLNVAGSRKMKALSEELDFPYRQNGSLVLCFEEEGRETLRRLKQNGEKNKVEGLRLLEREEVLLLEPNLSKEVVAALYAETGGIVCPFGLTIALAENACENGVEFQLGTLVTDIKKQKEGYLVTTSKGDYEGTVVINAAGVYGDELHNKVSKKKLHITPRKGEYCLMDKGVGTMVSRTIFQLPTAYGKGILVTPTVHGNLLLGPTAFDLENKEGVHTTAEGLEEVLKKANISVPGLPGSQIITSFAGLRAHEAAGDFIIEEAEDAKGFLDVTGIESPGLTSAPAIGEYVANLLLTILPAPLKKDFQNRRQGIPMVTGKQIAKDRTYANVICRCEMVTEGEILSAIHRPLGATTVDGVKRRTRAGMGRCQGGFCGPKIMELLAKELKVDMSQIKKAEEDSGYLTGFNKQWKETGGGNE